MREARSFLVIADDSERLFLTANTLHRKFPNSVVHTCRESEVALEVSKSQKLDAIVAHRSTDLDELPLLEELRKITAVPIVMIGPFQIKEAALAGGAAAYLAFEQWLLIGAVVADLIHATSV